MKCFVNIKQQNKKFNKTNNRKNPLQKKMATYPSILAWENPWSEEPGGLQFMGTKSWA